MANLIPENIRELLTKYAFEIEGDNYDEKLICKICKKLMLDVYQSHCGCNFCHKCISDYLNEEAKYCPGEKEECKEEHLTLDINVTSNPRLNKKILKTKVRCPYESCLCFFALAQMEEHMRLCDKQDRECPYVNIGCEDGGGLCKDKIMDHLHNEVFTHSKLLIELVENMRNDVNGLKLEIVSLKEESQRKEMEMERQSREIEGLKEEVEIKEMEMERQNREIENLKEDTIVKETKMREIEDNIKKAAEENKNMKEKLKKIKIKTVKMENSVFYLNIDNDDLKETLKSIKKMLEKESNEYKNGAEAKFATIKKETSKREMKDDDEEIKKIINQKKAKIETLPSVTNTAMAIGEIYFTVDKFSERKKNNECILSPYFYSHYHGYKLQLEVNPRGVREGKDSHLSLHLHICKGEYDQLLQWPCQYIFNISIINQRTKRKHISETFSYLTVCSDFKYVFGKHVGEYNNKIGFTKFISHSDIDLCGGIKVDNCIIVKCFVSAPT